MNHDAPDAPTVPLDDEDPSVLIVDDDELVRTSFTHFLSEYRYRILGAPDGVTGLQMFADHRPTVVLLDLRLPRMDGLDVLAQMTQRDPDVPVVVISGHGSYDDVVTALRHGAWDFLEKPIMDLEILHHAVERALAHAALRRENKRQFRDLERSHAQLVEAMRETEEARQRAEAAYAAQAAFWQKIGAELLIPAQGVESITHILYTTELTPEQRQYVRVIQSSMASLNANLNTLLDYARIENDDLPFQRQRFQLKNAVTQTLVHTAEAYKSDAVTTRITFDEDMPQYYIGDPWRLCQVLSILLENAFKYTREGSVEVAVSAQVEGTAALVRFEVRDTGVGISSQSMAAMFEAFSQDGAHPGLGLGLALARKLVAAMEGRIGATSTPGEGSVFWFSVRLHIQEGGDQHDETGWTAHRAPVDTAVHDLRVLVATPHEDLRLILTAFLTRIQAQWEMATTGPDALEHLEERDFDIVLLDEKLPIVAGMEIAGIVRSELSAVRNHDIPIVFLCDSPPDPDDTRTQRFEAVLRKPFSFGEMVYALHKALRPSWDDAPSVTPP